jgi:DNA replication protein DnaC
MKTIYPKTDDKIKVTIFNHCPECGKNWNTYIEIEKEYLDILQWGEEQNNIKLCDECELILMRNQSELKEKERISEELATALLPPDFCKWNKEIGNNELARFIQENKDKHIFLSGMYGKGKSRCLAINFVKMIANNENKKLKYFRFTDIAIDYASICRENIGIARTYLKEILNNDIIIIDDLAKKRITENAGEFLYDIFDNIYCGNAKCKLWVSSNINWRKLASLFENKDCGNAVVSRIDRLISESRLVEKEV